MTLRKRVRRLEEKVATLEEKVGKLLGAGNTRDDILVAGSAGNWVQEWYRPNNSTGSNSYWAKGDGGTVTVANDYISMPAAFIGGGTWAASISTPTIRVPASGYVYVKIVVTSSAVGGAVDASPFFGQWPVTGNPIPFESPYGAGTKFDYQDPTWCTFFFRVPLSVGDGNGYTDIYANIASTANTSYTIKIKSMSITTSHNVLGGTSVYSSQDGYAIHSFYDNSGNVLATQLQVIDEPEGGFQYYVAGGGGGGGAGDTSRGGGGGGAGGTKVGSGLSLARGYHDVTVGSRGTGGAVGNNGVNGGDSWLSTVTVTGGGGGGRAGVIGNNGGSGGGAGGSTGSGLGLSSGVSGEGYGGGGVSSGQTGGASGGSKQAAGNSNAVSGPNGMNVPDPDYTTTFFGLGATYYSNAGAGGAGTGGSPGGAYGGGNGGSPGSVGGNAGYFASGGGGGGTTKAGGNGKGGIVAVKYKLN